jgi:hypothetical protein
MRSPSLLAIASALTAANLLPLAAGEEGAAAFLGRWNLRIDGTGDTFSTSWLKVEEREGGTAGACVWKWGSVTSIQDVAVEGGELRFRRGKETFKARRMGEELRGEATMEDGKKFTFSGRRAGEMCDVAGTWKVWPMTKPDAARGTLVLEEKDGKITGRAVDPDGIEYEIADAKLEGYALALKVQPKEGPVIDVRCEVRGDVLAGKAELTPPGETEKKSVEFEGKRERKWGPPVALLAKDGLDGWKSRDENRKLGWKVADGVLENSPPDVDIKSDAEFRDFRLHLEYNVEPGSNSGVYLRGRYELQVLGDTRIQDHGNMALYSRLKPGKNPVKPGEWNSLDVTFIGRWLTVVLNGETVYDNQYVEGPTGGAYDPDEEKPGPLLLQGDHGKIRYRNIVVTPAG